MKTILKRFGLALLAAIAIAPMATLTAGCEGDVDEDGASLEVGE